MNRYSVEGSSSSRSRRTWKYEVFLSFRGEDTRNTFTDHLFAALQRKGVFTFRDDKRLRKGDSIAPELLKAIEQSKISIVVFSKNYADSTWCLDELAKISKGISEPGYTVVPIFYDVDPSEVRKQSNGFGKAFDIHEQRFRLDLEKVQRWRLALNQVANLSGWDVRNKSESEVIDKIVKDTISKLGHKFSSLADDLVGMQSRVGALENLLDLDSDDVVRFVGIWGMGGSGKTTLAAVVYDRISHRFDACCFLADVSKVYKGSGLVRLQEQLLCETVDGNQKIQVEMEGISSISTRLCHRKTLIVVDNVDHINQLEKLAGNPDWFGAGSRIIITTRDEHILNVHGVREIYKVELLNPDEARQLLCRKAFKRDDPKRNFESMTDKVLDYAQALPLAIRVLGSLLFDRDESQWRSQLARLQGNPNKEIMDVFQTSFESLDEEDKEIFVDIACFFKGAEENYVMEILEHCGLNPAIGVRDLIEKSLISIVNGNFWMHDMLQELGCKIAKGKSPDKPEKWSRLWLFKDLQAISIGKDNVKAIVLNQDDLQEGETPLKTEALSQMRHLRLLIFPNANFSGNLNNLSNELRHFSWHKYPFTYLPSSFEPGQLAELNMPDSNIRKLWEGIKTMPKLRRINLRGCKALIKTPNFRGVPNLERLDLEGCTGLLQVDPSIGVLQKLTFLNLRNCEHLISVPNSLFLLSSLETLNFSGCLKLAKRLNFEGPR